MVAERLSCFRLHTETYLNASLQDVQSSVLWKAHVAYG